MVGHFLGGHAVIYWIRLGVSCCACSTQILEDAIGLLNLDLAQIFMFSQHKLTPG